MKVYLLRAQGVADAYDRHNPQDGDYDQYKYHHKTNIRHYIRNQARKKT